MEEISFSLKQGEILGVAGLRGSGQQVLVNTLLGLESNYRGTMRIFGATQRIKSPRHASHLGIGYVTDDRKSEGLLGDKDAGYNGTLGVIPGSRNMAFCARSWNEHWLTASQRSRHPHEKSFHASEASQRR